MAQPIGQCEALTLALTERTNQLIAAHEQIGVLQAKVGELEAKAKVITDAVPVGSLAETVEAAS